jgi:hypothetical protein
VLTLGALNRRGREIQLQVRLAPMDVAGERGVIVLMQDHDGSG